MNTKGFDRAQKGSPYYYVDYFGYVVDDIDARGRADDLIYGNENYYLDKDRALNDARADLLMRKLRRFSLKRQKDGVSWGNSTAKFCILFDNLKRELFVTCVSYMHGFGQVYFETLVDAEDAIKEFETELLWYFKEYSNRKPS